MTIMDGILIDENVFKRFKVASKLRKFGWNAVAIGERDAPPAGTKDPVIVNWANKRGLLIISRDKGSDLESTVTDRVWLDTNAIKNREPIDIAVHIHTRLTEGIGIEVE